MLSFCQPILNNFNSGLHALIRVVSDETSKNLLPEAVDHHVDLLQVDRGLPWEQLGDLILHRQLRLSVSGGSLRFVSPHRLVELDCRQLGF